MKEVTLIASGPSCQPIVNDPSLAKGSVAVVNRVGMFYPGVIDYWFSCHGRYMHKWKKFREHENYRTFSCEKWAGVGEIIRMKEMCQGSSSLYAVALLDRMLGYDRVYLHGVDLNGYYEQFREAWDKVDLKIEIIGRQF